MIRLSTRAFDCARYVDVAATVQRAEAGHASAVVADQHLDLCSPTVRANLAALSRMHGSKNVSVKLTTLQWRGVSDLLCVSRHCGRRTTCLPRYLATLASALPRFATLST